MPTPPTAPPVSAVLLSDDRKTAALIATLAAIRAEINSWKDKAFQATSWSIGIVLAATSYWIANFSDASLALRLAGCAALLLFGALTQAYLLAARRAHRGSGRVLARIEVALRFTEHGAYLKDECFFNYSNEWLAPRSITALQVLHFSIVILCAIVLTLI